MCSHHPKCAVQFPFSCSVSLDVLVYISYYLYQLTLAAKLIMLKFCGFKQRIFIISEFLRVRDPSTPQLGSLLHGLLNVYNQGFNQQSPCSSEVLTREGSTPKSTSVVVGRSQFLLGWSPPSVPFQVGLFNTEVGFIKVCKLGWQQKKYACRMEVSVYNLITEVISHQCYHILFVTSTRVSPHKGSRLEKSVNIMRWRLSKTVSKLMLYCLTLYVYVYFLGKICILLEGMQFQSS